jgi:hypothetical protein
VLEQFHHAVADRRAAIGAAGDAPQIIPIPQGIEAPDARFTTRSK